MMIHKPECGNVDIADFTHKVQCIAACGDNQRGKSRHPYRARCFCNICLFELSSEHFCGLALVYSHAFRLSSSFSSPPSWIEALGARSPEVHLHFLSLPPSQCLTMIS